MNDYNYSPYWQGLSFQHFWGYYKRLPVVVGVPNGGNWNTVIDLDGGRANVRYSIDYLN